MASANFGQEGRSLTIETPLGKDVLKLESFTGHEEVSRPFVFSLQLLSHDAAISAADIVGKAVTITVNPTEGKARSFHGHVSHFTADRLVGNDLRRYHATVVPWLWFLTKRRACRIFQQKTVLQIAQQIFGELKLADYDAANVRATLPKLDYCVQYRESDFDFLSRLFEEAGIFYYFEHGDGQHVLKLADSKVAYADCEENEVAFSPGTLTGAHIAAWEHRYEFVSGNWSHADYNFEKPLTKLRSEAKTVVELPGVDPFEVYDYPGRFPDGALGDARAQVRMEEEEVGWDQVEGESGCRSFTLGGKFKLVDHECDSEQGKEYVLVELTHRAADASYQQGGSAQPIYSNSFRCIPAAVVFRPQRKTPKAVVHGPQTAVVVGPSGEEIYTDVHGRVKVQFHWDREGKSDANSSCWIRVAQGWAGKAWGAIQIPRIGQEVVVEFLEGDPDRPLITGSVYNADQTPPYELPANKTQSGVKSRSSKGGNTDTFNELRFEDKTGSELVYFHSQKDQTVIVENDQAVEIGHDQTVDIGHDQSVTVGNDQTLHVAHDRNEAIDNDRNLQVGANKLEDVTKNKTVSVGGNHTESITGEMSLTVEKSRTMSVTKNLTEDIGEAMTVNVGKDSKTSVGANDSLDVKKVLTVTAGDEITFKTGQASIVLKKDGTITIKGKNITVDGSGDVTIKAAKNVTVKGQKITQN